MVWRTIQINRNKYDPRVVCHGLEKLVTCTQIKINE